jgi:RNA polymerase sigma-70 factor, ECF subfamily
MTGQQTAYAPGEQLARLSPSALRADPPCFSLTSGALSRALGGSLHPVLAGLRTEPAVAVAARRRRTRDRKRARPTPARGRLRRGRHRLAARARPGTRRRPLIDVSAHRSGVTPNRASPSGLDKGVRTFSTEAQLEAERDSKLPAAAFREFVAPHWPAMERLARRLALGGEWDDVLQEALITAWRKRHQFDPARGSARAWLLAVVADKAYKSRRRRRAPDEPLQDVGVASDGSARLDVQAALNRLAKRQLLAITLHYYLGLSTAETAEVMRCSIGTVKSTLSDARHLLKKSLGEDYRHA